MKYRYVSTKGSVLQMRLIVSIVCIVAIFLISSYFIEEDSSLVMIHLGTMSLLLAYISSRFSNIKYNSEEIVVQNIFGSTRFVKSDFVQIRPLRSYLNFYVIVFKNNRSYLFGLASSEIFLTDYAKENAAEMERELLSNEGNL